MQSIYKLFNEAERVALRYNCATCYGHLVIFDRGAFFEVICARKEQGDCSGDGFVTKEHVEYVRAQSCADRSEARYNLSKCLGIFAAKRSANQAINDIWGGE